MTGYSFRSAAKRSFHPLDVSDSSQYVIAGVIILNSIIGHFELYILNNINFSQFELMF